MLVSCSRLLQIALLSAGLSTASIMAITAWAEDAPVYDVDNYPPSFDGQPNVPNAAAVEESPSPRTATIRLSEDQRVARLEQQLKNLTDNTGKAESLQTEVQTLRGQVEELTHQLQQAQNQQRLMYSDLDKRLAQHSGSDTPVAAIPAAPPAPAAAAKEKTKKTAKEASKEAAASLPEKAASKNPAASAEKTSPAISANQPNPVEEQQIYQTAYDFIKEKKYNEAISALKKMLEKYPSGQFAANAHYWLGELYGLLNKNDLSAAEFASVVKDYPDSPKVADAQLKLGLINAAEFNYDDAKAAFKKVIAHYPGTPSARLAAEQLKQLKPTMQASAKK